MVGSPPRAGEKESPNQTNRNGRKGLELCGLMGELSGLCRLVVVPKISTDAAPEVVMIEKIRAIQKRAFKLLGSSLL